MMSDNEVTFGTLTTTGGLENVTVILKPGIYECPWYIMTAMHYRDDGSCRCNDPAHLEMKEWGYNWDGEKWDGKGYCAGHKD